MAAASSDVRFVLLSVFLFVCVSSQLSYAGNVKAVVREICSITKNPSYCTQQLNSIPGVTGLTRSIVANSMINEVVNQATENINFIALLNPTPQQKPHLNFCNGRYDAAISDFGTKAADQLGRRDYFGLKGTATTVSGYATQCENSFRSSPAAPSPLTQRNQYLFDQADIVRALAILLSR